VRVIEVSGFLCIQRKGKLFKRKELDLERRKAQTEKLIPLARLTTSVRLEYYIVGKIV